MTDFLADLLERSRGQVSGLVPRIPSVFEPPRGGTSWPAGTDTVRMPADAPAAAGRVPSEGVPQPSPGAGPSRRAGPSRQAAARPRSRIPAPSPEAVPPGSLRIPARTGPRAAGEPALPQAGPLVPHATAGTRPAGPAAHRPRPPATVSGGGDQRVPRPEIEQDMAERRGPGALGPPAATVGEPLPPPRRGLLTTPRPGAFAGSPAFPGPAGDPAPPPEPTVHVTIGRVEIRAVTAPAPPARPAPAARAMGLDEYLAERNQRRQA
jgi:hypothetical protein